MTKAIPGKKPGKAATSRPITIDDSDYRKTHARKPAGVGAWAFCVVRPDRRDYLDHIIWARGEFAEARASAIRIAQERGVGVLYVCA
jgi:hypothetical protein